VSTATLKLGRALFRYRSVTPVPVLALIAFLLYRSRAFEASSLWLVFGGAVALCGQALRFYTLSWVQDGTSGQDDELEAKALNTRGPYAYVRNPLYLGNLLICLGLMLAARDGMVALVGLGFFFGEYFFIIRAEEDFLAQRFGEQYLRYSSEVPRWVPRLEAAYGGRLREGVLDWRRGLKKEHNPFTAWALGLLALSAWERLARGATVQSLESHAVCAAVILVLFLGVKTWKRGWLS
jgi:protein-S-isoprenylcysteine O-methyltransferase Ste14